MSIRSALAALAAFTYPGHCEICGIPLLHPHCTLCPWCELPPLPCESACARCDEPGFPICAACDKQPILDGRVFTAGIYDGVNELAIKAFKYQGHRRLAPLLSRRLSERLCGYEHNWSMIVPIPSSPASLATRGFHHTLLLAALLGKALRLPVARWTLAYRSTPRPQASLPPDARWANIRETLGTRTRVRGHLLLVDDVLTTGATLNEAGRVLHEAGASAIDAIALVRSKWCLRYRLEHSQTANVEQCETPQQRRGA